MKIKKIMTLSCGCVDITGFNKKHIIKKIIKMLENDGYIIEKTGNWLKNIEVYKEV